MRDVCAEGAYSRSLALAQGVKGLGSTASSYLVTAAASMVLFAAMGWRGAFPIFFALTALAFLSVAMLRVDETRGGTTEAAPSIANCLALLGRPGTALAVLGIFLYVGAEVCMGTFLKPALSARGFSSNSAALAGPSLFFGALTVSRLVAGSVKVGPRTFFRVSAGMGLVGLLAFAVGLLLYAKAVMVFAIVICALGFANIWPMLFAITVEERPERASELSGLMCMAICGGAVIPLCMGALGGGAAAAAFMVPFACFAYLAVLSVVKVGNIGNKG
jgi:fucose permease